MRPFHLLFGPLAACAVALPVSAQSPADSRSKANFDFLIEAHMAMGMCHEHIVLEDKMIFARMARQSTPELKKILLEAEAEGVMMSREYNLDSDECHRMLREIGERRAAERKTADR